MPYAANDERTLNDELYDAKMQHDHYILAVEAFALYMWLNSFRRGVDDAIAILVVTGMGGPTLADLPPAALSDALHRADIILADAADRANDGLIDNMLALFSGEATANARILRDLLPSSVDLANLTLLPRTTIYNLINTPIGGKTLATRLKDLVASARRALSDAARALVSAGGSIMDLIRLLKEFLERYVYRPLDRLVRTEIQRVASMATLFVYRQYPSVIETVMWVATLDNTTCDYCEAMHGTVYYSDPKRSPNLDDIPPQPAHPRCRCSLVGGTASARSLGIGEEYAKRITGKPATVYHYPEWLAHQTFVVRERILGSNRHALWRNGRLKVRSVWEAVPSNLLPIAPEDVQDLLRME